MDKPLTKAEEKEIHKAVKKVIKEYGKTLKLLTEYKPNVQWIFPFEAWSKKRNAGIPGETKKSAIYGKL